MFSNGPYLLRAGCMRVSARFSCAIQEATMKLKTLSVDQRRRVLDTSFDFPTTNSLTEDIVRAERLGVLIYYSDIKKDKTAIMKIINENPKFCRVGSKDINMEMLHLIAECDDGKLGIESFDCILMRRNNTPIFV